MMRPTILDAAWNDRSTAEDGPGGVPLRPAVEGSPTASIQRGTADKKMTFEQELHQFGKDVSTPSTHALTVTCPRKKL